MNPDDMLKLFQRPMTPRPEAIKEAERILTERDQTALRKAQEKRERKQRRAMLARAREWK